MLDRQTHQQPVATQLTPKQYHAAMLRWRAAEYGRTLAEVRSFYDDEGAPSWLDLITVIVLAAMLIGLGFYVGRVTA